MGSFGGGAQSLVAAFVMALLSGRTLLVSWPVSPGLSNETVSDLFEVPPVKNRRRAPPQP